MIMDAMMPAPDAMTLLAHLGVIRAEGPDAASFLHGQLTQDFSLLGMAEARLAAYCTPKGRIQASFIGLKRSPQEILLVCQRDLLEAVRKRLSMFVLRSKVRLVDVGDTIRVAGLLGAVVADLAPAAAQPWARQDHGSVSLVRLYPAGNVARALWIAPQDVPLPMPCAASADDWLFAEVQSGVAMVGAAVAEAFVPQMLNYESVGGVSFKKGCYPGQEVVARSQFRGTLKRRAMLAHGAAAMAAGQEIFAASDPQQPCATVVQAAPNPAGGWEAIVSGQVSLLLAGALHLHAADGPPIEVRPAPYPLLDDL